MRTIVPSCLCVSVFLTATLTSFDTNPPETADYNAFVIRRVKSSLLLAGLPLILLPLLAVLQYRWIGEVSAAERDRLESSLRVASEHFASDFDAELTRLANSFQIREGYPENAAPIVERYQTWSDTSPYPRIIRNLYLWKPSTDGRDPEFKKIDLQSGEMEPAPLPKELLNRFRPGNIIT